MCIDNNGVCSEGTASPIKILSTAHRSKDIPTKTPKIILDHSAHNIIIIILYMPITVTGFSQNLTPRGIIGCTK